MFKRHSQQYFRYVMATSFSGGRTEVPGDTYRPWASNSKTVSLGAASQVHPFCNLQSWAQTQAVLVIDLYELLGNPAT